MAKRVHPDLATDEADRQRRDLLMAGANAAYQRGDADALRRILEEYESSPESVRGVGIAADLVRAIRQIKQVRRRLTQIEIEIERLNDSEIARLRIKADAARAEGRELLAEMAEDVRLRIDLARRRFEAGCRNSFADAEHDVRRTVSGSSANILLKRRRQHCMYQLRWRRIVLTVVLHQHHWQSHLHYLQQR